MILAVNYRCLLLAKQRCFKNIKTLPCRYRAQKKSWMGGVLFEEWVRDLNKKFESKKRKVALIIGNCPAHPIIDNLSYISQPSNLVNCFKIAKISDKDQNIAINDEDDPFKEINEDLSKLREKDSSLVPESMTQKILQVLMMQ